MQQFIRSYRHSLPHDRRRLLERYRYVHAARKVVGVGSVGTRAWILLLLGRDENDPLFLQFKEAEASVLEPFLGKSEFAQHGQRVVEGQRMMQAASDIMLGWERAARRGRRGARLLHPPAVGREELGARRADAAASVRGLRGGLRLDAREGPRALGRRDRDQLLPRQGRRRSTGRWPSFAEAYADQNERDYKALQEAASSGRISAHLGL